MSNTVAASITVGNYPEGISVTPDGKKVYVANMISKNISVIDTATNDVTADVNVGNGGPIAFGQFICSANTSVLPIANSTCNVTNGNAPLTVQFNDSSLNASEYYWVFADGNSSYEQNPMHTFSTAGSYNVMFTVRNENGTDTKLVTINVTKKPAPALPVANFSTNVTSGFVPLTVQFIDLSTNATSYYWDFGDKTNSTSQNTTHTYSAPGSYTVKLNASNNFSSKIKQAKITFQTIAGYCFNDTNKDGAMNPGEVGIPNMDIKLYGYDTLKKKTVTSTTKTSSTGYYGFSSINPGVYIVLESFTNDWLPTGTSGTRCGAHTVTVTANSTSYGNDLGDEKSS